MFAYVLLCEAVTQSGRRVKAARRYDDEVYSFTDAESKQEMRDRKRRAVKDEMYRAKHREEHRGHIRRYRSDPEYYKRELKKKA